MKLLEYKTIKIIGSLALLFFVMIEGVIIMGGMKKDVVEKVDYVVILGAGLKGDQPSKTLKDRLMKGLEYLKSHSDIQVVVTGGQGPDEYISEAEAMARFLVARGIEKERIILENQSTSTMENLKFTKKILMVTDENTNPKILIITNRYHLYRAKLLAKRNGFIPYGLPVETRWYLIPKAYTREIFALIKSFVVDR